MHLLVRVGFTATCLNPAMLPVASVESYRRSLKLIENFSNNFFSVVKRPPHCDNRLVLHVGVARQPGGAVPTPALGTLSPRKYRYLTTTD